MREHPRSLGEYLHVLRVRKWVVLAALVVVPAAAVFVSLREHPLYRASAEVLLSSQNLATSLTGVQTDTSLSSQPERFAQTQSDLARVPTVANRTLLALGVKGRTSGQFLAASSAEPKSNSDVLTLSVRDRDPTLAQRLVNEYARQFTIYRQQLDTQAIRRTLDEVNVKIARLKSAGAHRSPLYKALVDKQQLLTAIRALQTPQAYVVRAATNTVKVRPRPVRNGILGLALGLFLGIGLAFLRESLDTRLKSANAVGDLLGLPLLARLPKPPRALSRQARLVMLERPESLDAEPFRVLRKNLDFVNLDRGAKVILVTSSVEGEGKSTTVANLAVAFARAGRRVVLVDLDVRRPYLDRFFDLNDGTGMTAYTLGDRDLKHAGNRISLNGGSAVGGSLHVIPVGPPPPLPGEFVASRAVAEVLRELRVHADVVLIDSPPLLALGDALSLMDAVDATVVVTRLSVVRRQTMKELRRILDVCPADKLGFVAADAQAEQGYGYGYDDAYHYGYTVAADSLEKRLDRAARNLQATLFRGDARRDRQADEGR